jgi:hypothetical protein
LDGQAEFVGPIFRRAWYRWLVEKLSDQREESFFSFELTDTKGFEEVGGKVSDLRYETQVAALSSYSSARRLDDLKPIPSKLGIDRNRGVDQTLVQRIDRVLLTSCDIAGRHQDGLFFLGYPLKNPEMRGAGMAAVRQTHGEGLTAEQIPIILRVELPQGGTATAHGRGQPGEHCRIESLGVSRIGS